MKKGLLAFLSFCTLVFTGCNSIGEKDTLVARVNGEPIYKEDYAFMMSVGNIVPNTEQMRKASGSLFSRKALYTVALQKYPEFKDQLAAHNVSLENYLLTFIYQRLYSMDRLMYSDDELAFYYDKHRDQFPDSLAYMNLRDKVADAKYIEANQDSLRAYAFQHRNLADSTAEVKITDDIKESFVSEHRQRIVRETGPALLKKYNIQETEIQLPSAEVYYEKHKNKYTTPNGFVVYHVEAADSSALAKRFKGKKVDLKGFMKPRAMSARLFWDIRFRTASVLSRICLLNSIHWLMELFLRFSSLNRQGASMYSIVFRLLLRNRNRLTESARLLNASWQRLLIMNWIPHTFS